MRLKDRVKRRFFIYESEDGLAYKNGFYGGGGGKGGGGGGQSYPAQTTQINKSEPWDEQKPYLTRGFVEAQRNILDSPQPQFYPNSTVVPFAPETNMAMQLQAQRALSGSPIQSAGEGQLASTLSGDYLNAIPAIYNNAPLSPEINNVLSSTMNGDYLYGNPGFDAAFDAASRKIIPQVDSAFERSGRTGSGLAQQAKTQALSDAFASQYGQERQNQLAATNLGQQGRNTMLSQLGTERENIMRSMFFAPQMAQLDYQDFGKLAEVGAQKEALDQQNLSEQIARWDYDQNKYRSAIAQYMNLIQGNYGGTSTSTSTVNGGSGGSGFSPNILGGIGGMLMAPSLGMSPAMGLLGGLK